MKIKNCSEAEAHRVFLPSSVSFNSGSMKMFLGSGGAILRSDSDSCKIATPDAWRIP